MMQKISVVLPVYNGADYLAASIQSVINQTYQNWEMIIVDDASTDNTPEIIAHFMKKDKRIQSFANPENIQLPESLNAGFKKASGEYFTWTSDDNIYDENAFKSMAEVLDNTEQCGLVFCDTYYINHSGDIVGDNAAAGVEKNQQGLLLSNCINACFMYRRSAADFVGGYDPNMILVEDYDYWLRISFHYQVKHIAKKLYAYRLHDKNLSYTKKDEVSRQFAAVHVKHFDSIISRLPESERQAFYIGLWLIDKNAANKVKDKLIKLGLDKSAEKLIQSLEHKCPPDNQKQYIIFGAGIYGQMALNRLGLEQVAFFADNFKTGIDSVSRLEILSFSQMQKIYRDYNILIAADHTKSAKIIRQFEDNGIDEYSIYVEN